MNDHKFSGFPTLLVALAMLEVEENDCIWVVVARGCFSG